MPLILALYGDWGLLVLRVVLGVIFLVHGWPKIKDLRANARNFGMMGFAPGIFWGTLIALLEFFGGIGLIFGIFTRFLGGLYAAEFIVTTVWRNVKKHPFAGGWEFDLLILAGAIVLLTAGAGALSFDGSWMGGF